MHFRAPLTPETDALHRGRMLVVEERAYKRVRTRVIGSEFLGASATKTQQADPAEGDNEDAEVDPAIRRKKRAEDYQKLRDDVLLDFATFEANVVRTQLLLDANAKERERYAAEKLRIQEEAERVRSDTTELRAQLEQSQQTLERRKGWDRLAEKITNNRMLRTREEQNANIDKLNAEIAELEQESKDYAETWAERRSQFGRIVDEGMQMLRLIKDEKEEVERREGMEGQEDGDEDGGSARGRISNAGTPRPEGGATPLHLGTDTEGQGGLLHPGGKTSVRGSPAPEADIGTPAPSGELEDDEDMADEGEVEDDDVPEEERTEKDTMDIS